MVRNEGSLCLMTTEGISEHIFPLGPGKFIFNRGTKSLKLCWTSVFLSFQSTGSPLDVQLNIFIDKN